MEIKTALQILHEKGIILEPVLDKNFNINATRDCWIGTLRDINNAMQEYAAQFIDLAADEIEYVSDDESDYYRKIILNLKKQIQ